MKLSVQYIGGNATQGIYAHTLYPSFLDPEKAFSIGVPGPT
jgi:hypothetical protein